MLQGYKKEAKHSLLLLRNEFVALIDELNLILAFSSKAEVLFKNFKALLIFNALIFSLSLCKGHFCFAEHLITILKTGSIFLDLYVNGQLSCP